MTAKQRGKARGGARTRWSKARLALLGTMPDAQLAKKLGAAPNTVLFRRRKLGIPPYAPSTKHETRG